MVVLLTLLLKCSLFIEITTSISLRISWAEPNILTNDTVTFDERHASVTTRCLRNERMVHSFYYHDLSQGQSVLERTCAHARAWEDLSGNS